MPKRDAIVSKIGTKEHLVIGTLSGVVKSTECNKCSIWTTCFKIISRVGFSLLAMKSVCLFLFHFLVLGDISINTRY